MRDIWVERETLRSCVIFMYSGRRPCTEHRMSLTQHDNPVPRQGGARCYYAVADSVSLHCTLSLAAQCIVIGPVCLKRASVVCGFVDLLPR